MIANYRLFEISPAQISALKQAAVWGVGGLLSARAGQNKKDMTPEKKKKLKKQNLTAGGLGALSGAISTLV